MPESTSNQLHDEIARYQKQLMDFYEIGKRKNPDYEQEAVVAINSIPNQSSEPPVAGSKDTGAVRQPLIPDNPSWSPEMEQAYLSQNPETGYIKTAVVTARGAIPLKDAQVTIFKTIDGMTKIFAHGLTDESGDFEKVALPTPSKNLSDSPDSNKARPYSTYDIAVTYPEYIPVISYGVPVFDNIVSIQKINMVPQSAAQTPDQIDEIYESEPTL